MTTFERYAKNFLGLDRSDAVFTCDGGPSTMRRVYLDTTATSLMPRHVWQGIERYLRTASGNSHTEAHRAGRDTTGAIEDSRDALGRLVGYDPARDVVLYTANGATGAANFLARALFPPELRAVLKRFPDGPPDAFVRFFAESIGAIGRQALHEMLERPLVVTTVMEHHSNLLPWVEAVGHHNVRAIEVDPKTGELRMDELREVLRTEGDRVRLVAVTGTSNVTGIGTPVREIARLAHAAGAEVLIDGAQWVPHAKVRLHGDTEDERIDYLVLSGHKMYAPGSRGALIGKLATIACRPCITDVGGGMVGYVTIDDFSLKNEVTAREEAGTPNIPGSIAMGLAAEMMMEIGIDTIAHAEDELTRYLMDRLGDIDGVTIYGSSDLDEVHRAGVVGFNLDGIDHSLVATYLDNYHNVAVRNGCFCAQPYVARLLQLDAEGHQAAKDQVNRGDLRNLVGMVRASLGIYSTPRDVDALARSLKIMLANKDSIMSRYESRIDGSYHLRELADLPPAFRLATR